MFHVPEKHRVKNGKLGSDKLIGNNGAFFVPRRNESAPFKIIASDGEGWEHVSVSLPTRCPNWEEMCVVKELFWDDEDVVMQVHPKKSEYVNLAQYCLHLWRPTTTHIPIPPQYMVG